MDLYAPWDPFSDYYQCSDGNWLAVIEKVYAKDKKIFAEIFNMPELLTDPDMETLVTMRDAGRVPEVTKKVEAAMLTRTAGEWQEILDGYDIPNELAVHYGQVYQDQQAWDNDCFEAVEYPEGTTAMPMPPIEFSTYGRKPFEKSTAVGGNTTEVLRQAGYTDEEIETMRKNGAIY
jgi:crotonobetainyl-CoA:carnitine CoA-transferase CaiB-like acyl-CoA transferase